MIDWEAHNKRVLESFHWVPPEPEIVFEQLDQRQLDAEDMKFWQEELRFQVGLMIRNGGDSEIMDNCKEAIRLIKQKINLLHVEVL